MSDEASVAAVKSKNSTKRQSVSSNNDLLSKADFLPLLAKKPKTSSQQGAMNP